MPPKRTNQDGIDEIHVHLQSGTGKDVDVCLHFYEKPITNDTQDVAQLFEILIESMKHGTFSALVDHILDWRRRCGYQIPLGFPEAPRHRATTPCDNAQTSLFPME